MGEVKIRDEVAVTPEEMMRLGASIRSAKIGYAQKGFHWDKTCSIDCYVHEQSSPTSPRASTPPDNKDEGAGDQGIMFGYACDETPELMPAPILYSHRVLRLLADARHSGGERPVLGPDAKSQVTVEYRDGKPVRAHTIVLSTQHARRRDDLGRRPRDGRALHHRRPCPRAGSTPTPSGTSTRPGAS